MKVGGYVLENGRKQLSCLSNPHMDDFLNILSLFETSSGVLSVEKEIKIEGEAHKLTLDASNGKFLMMLFVFYEDDGDEIRTYNNLRAKDVFVEILGETHHAMTICKDFDVVKDVFTQFNKNGDVSVDLLN